MEDTLPSSKPFELVVEGHEAHPFFIHSALVAEFSKPLDRHINNEMLEAERGRLVLKEVDRDTVARFCQWAYTGSYQAQNFSERIRNSSGPAEVDDSEDILLPVPKRDKNLKNIKRSKASFEWSEESSKKETLKSDFLKLQYSTPEDKRSVWFPRSNTTPSEDWTDTCLSHARLYVFAERFDIQPLKRLALENLHQTLAKFTVWPDCINDVVELLIYVYSNTEANRNGEEPMRMMLSQYVGFEMDKMLEATPFRDLLQRNRDFMNDFCAQVMKRI